ncbi:MAG: outer membrane beta-barrel protein, partial [Bacteroidota bacterium]
MLTRYSLLLSLIFLQISLAGQVNQDSIPTPESLSENLNTDPPGRFNLVFTRGFMLAGSAPDSVPLNGNASGTYRIGGGIKFPLGKKNIVGLRLTPAISWTHVQYNQTEAKTFPSIGDSANFSVEKHTMNFADLALSVYINLSRDEDNDRRFFVELGGYGSFLIAANYKTRYTNANGQRVKNK